MKKQPINFKKSAFSLIIFLFIISCATEKNKQSDSSQNQKSGIDTSSSVGEKQDANNAQSDSVDFSKLDTLIKNDLKILDEKYPWIPYYGKIDNKPFYISSNLKIEYFTELFSGLVKYGLINNSLLTVLDTVYDKISNPDLVLKDCFEISIGSKVGLYNYRTQEILQPQFDYILPSQDKVSEIAYGFKNDAFYSIKNSEMNKLMQQKIDIAPILKSLNFDILSIGQRMMYNSNNVFYKDEIEKGMGVVIIPSYLTQFRFFKEVVYSDVIIPKQKIESTFGTSAASLKISFLQQIKSKITSFLVTIYEEGIDARDYAVTTQDLMIYNKDKGTINSIDLWYQGDGSSICDNYNYKFFGDTLVEVFSIQRGYKFEDNLYEFEPRYFYYQIKEDGKVLQLLSNRHFPFTKFVFIDDSYFYGCYAWNMDDSERDDDHNMWQSDHLSLEDLDLMRNEIFAEYGLIFKSDKWKKYFSEKSWYSPKYEDVNDKLSLIDRTNLKVILKRQELLKKNEQKYTLKRPIRFYEAG